MHCIFQATFLLQKLISIEHILSHIILPTQFFIAITFRFPAYFSTAIGQSLNPAFLFLSNPVILANVSSIYMIRRITSYLSSLNLSPVFLRPLSQSMIWNFSCTKSLPATKLCFPQPQNLTTSSAPRNHIVAFFQQIKTPKLLTSVFHGDQYSCFSLPS